MKLTFIETKNSGPQGVTIAAGEILGIAVDQYPLLAHQVEFIMSVERGAAVRVLSAVSLPAGVEYVIYSQYQDAKPSRRKNK